MRIIGGVWKWFDITIIEGVGIIGGAGIIGGLFGEIENSLYLRQTRISHIFM